MAKRKHPLQLDDDPVIRAFEVLLLEVDVERCRIGGPMIDFQAQLAFEHLVHAVTLTVKRLRRLRDLSDKKSEPR
jgi:hypothetical protein